MIIPSAFELLDMEIEDVDQAYLAKVESYLGEKIQAASTSLSTGGKLIVEKPSFRYGYEGIWKQNLATIKGMLRNQGYLVIELHDYNLHIEIHPDYMRQKKASQG